MHCSELMDFDRNSITVLKEIVHLVRCAKIAITIPLPLACYFHDLSVSEEITSVSDCFRCIHLNNMYVFLSLLFKLYFQVSF